MKDKFIQRGEDFWNDINGIIELLNQTNKKVIISSPESPLVASFLLWRLLTENKSIKKSNQQVIKLLKEV